MDAVGSRHSRSYHPSVGASYHPSVGAAAVVVSVTSTPRQLLLPRGGRDDAPRNSGHPSSSSAVTAAVASIQWAPQQLSPLGVTRRGPITPPSGPSSRRGLSPRPHDRWWRLGVMRQNSVAGSSSPPKLPPRRRASAAAAVSVVATPQQLLPPREAAVESRRRSHPSPSLAVTAAVASTFWAPLQLPPLGEGVAARTASRRRASAAAAISVVATPQQLLPPREAAVESRRRKHPSPSPAVTAAVASTLRTPLQLPPLGEGISDQTASRRLAQQLPRSPSSRPRSS